MTKLRLTQKFRSSAVNLGPRFMFLSLKGKEEKNFYFVMTDGLWRKQRAHLYSILNPTFVVDMDITFAALPLISFLVRFFFFPKKEKKNYVAVKFWTVLEIKRIDGNRLTTTITSNWDGTQRLVPFTARFDYS